LTAKTSRAQERLNKLEKEIKGRGVRLAYERLQFAGLRLKSGLCWFRGDYFLFVDRFKTVPERIELIETAMQELDQLAAQNALADPTALAEPASQAEPTTLAEPASQAEPATLAEPAEPVQAPATPEEPA
jgi:hypothetical protein